MGCGALETIIPGLALSVAGAGAGAAASSKENSAMNNAVAQEIARQNQYSKQAKGVFQQSLGQSTPLSVNNQLSQGRLASLGALAQTQLPSLATSLPADSGFGNAGNAASAAGLGAQNAVSNQANAGTQAYSNIGLQQYLKDLQAKNQLGVINNNAQGWANLLPYQLQAAGTSQQGLSDLGMLLSGVGSGLTGYGIGAGGLTLPSVGAGASVPGFFDYNLPALGAGATMLG